MVFLQLSDFTTYMNAKLLNDVINGNQNTLNEAEASAQGFIVSNLSGVYNLPVEFGRTGDGRNRTLMRWVLSLATYHLYNLVPDMEIPERVDKNYNDARKEILNIAAGRGASDLTPIFVEGARRTKFRHGSEPKRSHFPY